MPSSPEWLFATASEKCGIFTAIPLYSTPRNWIKKCRSGLANRHEIVMTRLRQTAYFSSACAFATTLSTVKP
ncbi:hypothetical protein, partial [Serratia marcescens]|uniref:hypothetical protein n=1 Tax=Serratia marcescens TaxID=615 RepID=UPI002362842F